MAAIIDFDRPSRHATVLVIVLAAGAYYWYSNTHPGERKKCCGDHSLDLRSEFDRRHQTIHDMAMLTHVPEQVHSVQGIPPFFQRMQQDEKGRAIESYDTITSRWKGQYGPIGSFY